MILLLLHPFNGFFSRTTWVNLYQKGKTSLDLNEVRNDDQPIDQQIDQSINRRISGSIDQSTSYRPGGGEARQQHSSVDTVSVIWRTEMLRSSAQYRQFRQYSTIRHDGPYIYMHSKTD